MEWTEQASRLFVTADSRASDLTPREQLIRAIDLWESERWTRILVALDEQELKDIALADAQFSMAPLGQVRRATEAVARAWDADKVWWEMVVLALAITSHRCTDETLQMLGERLGMPSFSVEDAGALRNEVFGYLFFPEEFPDTESAGPTGVVQTSSRAEWVNDIAAFVSIGARVALLIGLIIVAVRTRDWIPVIACLGVVGATHAPQRDAEVMMSHTQRPGVLGVREPYMLWGSLLLLLIGYPILAACFAALWLTIRACTHIGEYSAATAAFIATAPEPGPMAEFIRPANRYAVRRRIMESVISVGAGILTALVLFSLNVEMEVTARSILAAALWAVIALEKSDGSWLTTSWRFWLASIAILAVLAFRLYPAQDWVWVLFNWPVVVVPPIIVTLAMRLHLRTNRLASTPLVSRQELGGGAIDPWRHLANALPGQVVADLAKAESPADSDRAALAIAYLEQGQPARARTTAAQLPVEFLPGVRRLVDNQAHAMLGSRPDPWPADLAPTTDLERAARLAYLRAATPFEDSLDIARQMIDLIPEPITRRNAYFAMECYLALSDSLRPVDAVLADLALTRAAAIAQIHAEDEMERLTPDALEAAHIRSPALILMNLRCTALARLSVADQEAGLVGELLTDDALAPLAQHINPYEVARYSNRGADIQLREHRRVTGDGLELRVQAFASLNVIRHRLTSSADRALWWGTFTRTLDVVLDEAYRYHDWRLLLEVIEAARLQLGTSREDLRPTAITLKGVSRLASQRFGYGDRPSPKSLESIMSVAGGPGSWWWASHVSNGHLYWALVGPDGSVQGGRIDEPVLDAALAALAPHLTVHLPDETKEEFSRRLRMSALFRAPSDFEAKLAGHLGQLLPPALQQAVEFGSQRSTVCMSLAPEIAHIPWAWVRVGQRRLVEALDTVIVPPASLVPDGAADAEQPCPVGVAVVNPGADLPAAEQTRALLPPGLPTVDSSVAQPISALSSLLQDQPYDSTLLLACHTTKLAGRRGFALAPLHGITEDDVLFADDVAGPDSVHPMPRQVIALACSSADLSSASAGEWTVLGTSLIQAGARRALVTAYPIFDLTEVDRNALGGTQEGVPLHVTLAQLQLTMLDRWRRRDVSAAPLRWGGLQLFGTLATGADYTEPPQERWVHVTLIDSLNGAAWWAPNGATEFGPEQLMGYLSVYGLLDGFPRSVRAKVRRRFETRLPPPLHLVHRWRAESQPEFEPRRISAELWTIIDDAQQVAREMGMRVIDVDHLFAAALRSNHPACVDMRTLTGLDTRNSSILHLLVDDSRDIMFHTGEATAPAVDADDVARVYELCGVTPPVGEEDGWWYNERLG